MAIGVFFPDNISEIHIELLKQLALFLKTERTQRYFEQVKTVDDLYRLITSTYNG